MTYALQASLFDDAAAGPSLAPLAGARRTHLGDGAWIDLLPGWMSGSDSVFDALVADVPWRTERRPMYDRVVDVPRLVSFFPDPDRLPHPALRDAHAALDRHYGAELGEDFATAGLCFYRDGRDSVAWHGDDVGRGATEDTMVAILSLGAARPLMLRPRGGGPSRRATLGHGDLVVMGGSCQRTWEHCIPKTTRPTGPRISVQFRPHGVR
ncbi:alpha-ketoglutarate-dependent dioxygenase AlkB [Rhodococcoides corynebacterioides]|uniref:alpha-ketoglutarate-dependent dioxygenase AlkB n=1 Tax=Rhodococcoides corynebacterioides TaxID=53972 RepID=UPI003F7FD56B